MKYFVVAVWSIILGNVAAFIVGQLSQQQFIPSQVTIFSLIIGEVAAIGITGISKSADNRRDQKKSGN
ncbi:YjzD family protein [Oenococcus alcoholitolerans]|uniref:YjzD family protein n=1 Tax=Oenococcus alcoholitolerans TaxID=931074 RepID=UPI003F6F2E3D